MDKEKYTLVQAGGLGIHQVCRTCGALVAMTDPKALKALPGTVTSEEVHTMFHDRLEGLRQSTVGILKILAGGEE